MENSLFLEDKMSSTTSEGGGKLLHVFVLIVVSCWVCVCFFCVWLTRKGKKMLENLGMCFLFKFEFVFFRVLVEDERFSLLLCCLCF